MLAKDEVPAKVLTPREKKEILQDFAHKQNDLGKRQREYKKVLSTRLKTRSERILDKSFPKTIERLRSERNDLRAQIWVAQGSPHNDEDQIHLQQIQCHIRCQENLGQQIKDLKEIIIKMEHEICNVQKKIYALNRKTVPDSQYQDYVARVRKKLDILENRLEVGVRRECGFTTLNAALREEIKTLLDHRTLFNTAYSKLVQKLNMDKKYLTDLLEYAFTSFEGGISINEKISNTKNKIDKEREQAKVEMQGIMRKIAADELVNGFMNCKGQVRALANLQPKEIRRREEFKRSHYHKIKTYNSVIEKIYSYTQSHNVDAVISNFQHHQSIYYSFFSYVNETGFHMTLLNNGVNQLFSDIERSRERNEEKFWKQREQLQYLEEKHEKQMRRNMELRAQSATISKNLDDFFQGVTSIFNMCYTDAGPIMLLLGNRSYVDINNVRDFLKLLEKRILNIVMNVYVTERENESIPIDQYVVKDLDKLREIPTPLDDIVLTQQCPECAEGETLNVDDGAEGGLGVLSIDKIKRKLFETVNQPEMQYRLHSISQCRLPRSRQLAAQRYM